MRSFTTWLVIAFSILGQECSGILTVGPSNTAVHEGSEAVLQCRMNTTRTTNTGSLLWRTQLSENDTIMTIYTGNKFVRNVTKELYNISNTTKGQFDLRIKAHNTTARRYFCEEPGVWNASAELIVLASDPSCTIINDSITNLRMECRLRYVGNWAPVMEWRQVSGEMENEAKLITDGITSDTSKDTVVSTLTVYRKETRSKYTFTTRFNANGRPRFTTAANIPEYSYNWTYSDDTLHTSSITAESSSTQQFSTDSDISSTTTAPADPSSVDNLKPILICMAILCILLVIMVCITYKKTNEGCISKCLDSNRRQNRAETSTTVAPNGVDERISPRVTDEGGDNTYVPVWQGTNYLQLCPGSVASLPVAKPEQGDEPPHFSRYMGDDGTVYMEMNGFRRQPTSAPQIHPPMHSSVVYAGIDHTLSPPPPK